MKSIKVKISKKDTLAFKPTIEWYAKVAEQLEKKILIFAGRTALNRDGVLVVNGEFERNRMCNGDKTLIDACEFIFMEFTKPAKGRNFATAFLGGRRTGDTSQCGRKSDKPKTEKDIAIKKKLKECVCLLEENGILPFKLNLFGVDYIESPYKMALVSLVHAKLTSYNEQVKEVKKEYDELTQQLIKIEEKLFNSYSDEEIAAFKSFVKDCATYEHRINFKFISFLRNGTYPYATNGYWIGKNDKKHLYSIKPEILKSLHENKSIITGENPLLISQKNKIKIEDYIELIHRHENKKEVPSYTTINVDTCKLNLGNNEVKFTVSQVENQLVWTFKNHKSESIQLITNHIRYGKGKHHYFENLKITPAFIPDRRSKTPKEKISGYYNIEFSINGKQPFKGTFKVPNIIYRNDEMFIQIPINIDKDEELEKNRKKIRAIYNTAPKIETFGSKQKLISIVNTERFDALKALGHDVRILCIDLGLRGIAGTIFSDNGTAETVHGSFHTNGDMVERLKIAAVVKEINKLKNTIDFTGEFYKLEDTTEIYNDPACAESKSYMDWLIQAKKNKIKLYELKHTKNNWLVSFKYTEIRKKFTQLKVDRLKSYDFLNMPFWANAVKQFINLSKSYFWIGMESPKKKNSGFMSSYADDTFFSTYNELYSNVKEDYAKKVGNYIVRYAVKNKIDIIVVEQLNSNLGHRDEKTRNENEMFLMWNCGRIKYHIENMAADYGIVTTEIDEYETSQICYLTGNYGYRDENNQEILWYIDGNGNLEQIHADENASANHGLKFLSHHTISYSFPIELIKDTTQYKLRIPEESKRFGPAAYTAFNSIDIIFDNVDERDKNNELCKTTRIFKINNEWVDLNHKKAYIKSIKTLSEMKK